MIKSLSLGVVALVGVGIAQTASAAGAPCGGAQAQAPVAQAPAAKAPPATAQAQRTQPNRSFSYSPSANSYYARPLYRGMRWNANLRPADSKALGNY